MKLRLAIWPLIILPLANLITIDNEPAIREVLTSQQLFVTKLTPIKGRFRKTKQKFEAELRDAFKVVIYKSDSTYVELDWTMCPDGKCPDVGQFEEGTLAYARIDSLIKLIPKK